MALVHCHVDFDWFLLSPPPATASAEGAQLNGRPSPRERVRVRGFNETLGTFTRALSQREREQRQVAQPTDKLMLTLP